MFIALGLLAGIIYGAADFAGGIASRRSSIFSVIVLSQAIGLVFVLASAPFLPHAQVASRDIVWGAAGGVCGGVGLAVFYRALAVGRMSVISPVAGVVSAVVPVVFGLAVGERPSALAVTGMVLALVAVTLVSYHREPGVPGVASSSSSSSSSSSAGLAEALVAGVAFGGFYVCLSRSGHASGIWPVVGARAASIGLFAVAALVARRSLRPADGGLPSIATAGVLDVAANVLFLSASRIGLLSLATVLTSLYPASTVILAWLLLKERLAPSQYAGVALAVVAIALLALG